ncbi:MAG: hypothetical protein ASARMPREDX12_008908 [Alectoria sarmentosa]|nr:MAG: hypothetical protein ASARMPREDX12_008908 [Alectoria sarmentosa]
MRGLSRFDELKQRPADMAIFQAVMTAYATSKTPWTDIFPTMQLFDARRLDVPLLVDVGGGAGHDIERLRKRLVHTEPGAIVLQDLRPVIERAAVHKSVRAMVHDFFEEQPIKGATAYYLHTVLHDWPDARAVAILSHIAAAAEPNYSRILIHETVVTDIPSAPDTTSDLQMMMALSSFERTESAWRDILAATGLDVVKIWRAPGSAESIIEAIRREGS